MNAVWLQIDLSVRLHFRNRMALVYNYLFPTMFLLAFWALYRYERVPLQAHMGELLTVTVLGGACFGLPTTMVSERERGVWRRYRLTPASTASIIAATLAARGIMLALAVLLQLVLALAIGMPSPDRPFEFMLAFSCAAVAFMGLGLVIAMLADTVPAVQALGQSVFLPMLIVGGVAVPLSRLPDWAQTLSFFLPGRYSVEMIQATVNGDGLVASWFSAAALLVIGVSACIAASGLFRWDTHERFAARGGHAWIAAAVVPWMAIGMLAQANQPPARDSARVSVVELIRPAVDPPAPAPSPAPPAPAPAAPDTTPAPEPPNAPEPPAAAVSPPTSTTAPPLVQPPAPVAEWRGVTIEQVRDRVAFDQLPPDSGLVTPLARPGEPVDPAAAEQLTVIASELEGWPPAQVIDPAQRARNLLLLAGALDLLQLPPERHVPRLVFDKLQREIPPDDLVRILYWIAIRWASGDHSAVDQMAVFWIEGRPDDVDQVRQRAAMYAVKLLGRLLGEIPD